MQINYDKKNTITERILQVIEYKGITKYKFCKDLGFSTGFLDKSREITTDKYANILVYFREISPEWLLTGEGEMLKQATTEQKEVLPCGACAEKDRIIKNLNDLIDRLRKK